MPTINEYLDLITSEHREKFKFSSMVSLDVSLPVRIQDLLLSMIPLFDVDLAVGNQLDIIGQWVGISRNVSVPIPNVYFEWDGTAAVGWDYGIWVGDETPTAITVLPDDVYRNLVKAKIAANHWDGTIDGAYAIWDAVFTNYTILIQDNQNMTYNLAFVGGIVDSLTLALVVGGYIPLKPEGVRLNEVYTPVDSGPLFGWDIENTYAQGWDEGSWGNEYTPS